MMLNYNHKWDPDPFLVGALIYQNSIMQGSDMRVWIFRANIPKTTKMLKVQYNIVILSYDNQG